MVLSIADFFRRMHRKEEGFTLIELLIVIAILAVLAAIAIPMIANRIDTARAAANDANLRLLEDAVALYRLDTGEECPSIDDLCAEKSEDTPEGYEGPYLKEAPEKVTGFTKYEVNMGVVSGGEEEQGGE